MYTLVTRQASSSAASPPPPPPPHGGPTPMTPEQLAALPHDSLGPELNAVIWSLTAVSAIFLALRLYCRAVRARVLWWDDWFLVAAWVAMFAACIVVSVTVTMGFGKHSWDIPFQDLPGIFKVFSVAGTFTICSSVWSKTSFALTILKLADVGWMRKLIWAIIITMNVFMGVTALINYIRCWPLDKLWDFTGAVEGTCWPMDVVINYDIFSAVYSGAMDILLAMLPWKLIWHLQMRRNEKLGVAVAMSLGIFAGVTSFVKASYMHRLQSTDVYDAVSLNYWANAESAVTIIAASIPLLRVLLKDVTKTIFTKQQYYGASGNTDKISSRLERENNHVTVTARSMHRTRPASQGTEGSELDILRKEGSPSKSGGILQTSNFVVEYEPRDWKGERSDGDGDGDGPQSA